MREMKDSGIAWVGAIPDHWRVMANKYLMKKIKVVKPAYEDEDILSLTVNGVIVRDLEAGGKMPTSFDGYQTLYPGNLLMCLFDYDVTPRCIGLIKNSGVTSPAYSQFVMKENNVADYYYYYYLMVDHTKALLHLARNLRHSFTEEQLGMIAAPVPPVDEQSHIAAYLDRRCAEIDAIVAGVQSQIELLEQYKCSVITEAVTKGLNPDVEMKESGIEWIGKIPRDWNVNKIKYVTHLRSVKFRLSDVHEYIGLENVQSGTGHYIKTDTEYTNGYYDGCEMGDLLYGKLRPNLSKVLIAPFKACCTGEFEVISACDIGKRYLQYFMLTDGFTQTVTSSTYGAKMPRANWEFIQNIGIVYPSPEERDKIVAYLDHRCTEIDAVIEDKKKQLAIIEDYRKSIIFEYVTGKKEVPVS